MGTTLRVEGLGKRYKLSHRSNVPSDSIKEMLAYNLWGKNSVSQEYFWALQDVSFSVQAGEIIGIIGQNGAGKSTLLKILARVTKPTCGRAEIWGRVGSLLEVGTGFHPELTGRENIYLSGAILGMSRREIKKNFDEMVEFSAVEKYLDLPVKRYSSGMFVRLAFAVASHLETEILFIDEVLAVGDIDFQRKCLAKLGEIAKSGRTIFFVSHNLTFIRFLCTRGLVFQQGKCVLDSEITQAVDTYVSGYKTSEPLVKLQPEQNKAGHQELEILSLELINGQHASFSVPWDDPIELALVYRATTPLQDLSFTLVLHTLEQQTLFTVKSAETLPLSIKAAGEKQHLHLKLRHHLRAGDYLLSISAEINNQTIAHYPSVAILTITEFGQRPYAQHHFGLMNCEAEWCLG